MTEQEILQHIDGMVTMLSTEFPEAFKKGENTDGTTSNLFQKAIETLLRYSIKLGERKAIDKARNWVILNTRTEFLHTHEHDDYPISYVREDGIKFYLSNNNVWLTEFVDSKYIAAILGYNG